MARDTSEDFKLLQAFVRDYSIRSLVDDASYRTLLSQQHKKYHAVLTLLSETQHQGWVPVPAELPDSAVNGAARQRLAEFVSDLGSALFVWIHGSYKGARLLLRSSIENLLKAIGVVVHQEILVQTSVYAVFDLAADQPFFVTPENQRRMQTLRAVYDTLCLDVHTATPEHMEQVGALDFFPHFVRDDAEGFSSIFLKVGTVGLEMLCLRFPELYGAMHRRNRDIVNATLGTDARAELNRRDRSE